jgi:hypothetical protein
VQQSFLYLFLRDRPNARNSRSTHKILVRNSQITKLLEKLIKWKCDIKLNVNLSSSTRKVLCIQFSHVISKSVALFDDSQASSASPSDNTTYSIKLKMGMEYWRNDTGRGNWSTGRETLYSVGGRWMYGYWALVELYWQGKTEVMGEKHYIVWVVGEWMSMEHWWNDTDRGKLKFWERNIIQSVTGGTDQNSAGCSLC